MTIRRQILRAAKQMFHANYKVNVCTTYGVVTCASYKEFKKYVTNPEVTPKIINFEWKLREI